MELPRILELCVSYEILRAYDGKHGTTETVQLWMEQLSRDDRFVAIAYDKMRALVAQEIILEGADRIVHGRARAWPRLWFDLHADPVAARQVGQELDALLALIGPAHNSTSKT